ncbi:MAG: CocE/NonD family hydrolase [Candidatus Acidiferrales bacterium]
MGIAIDRDVPVKMSDGVCLYADVYRSTAGATRPAVITRTPYLKETERFTTRAQYFADHGYVYVIQDVRGRGKAEGNFYPFFNEATDGYDTLTWAAKQKWSNGVLGTIGASYGAWTQWLTAPLRHPNLVTMIVEASPPDFFRCLPYQGGAFSLPLLSWLLELRKSPPRDMGSTDWDHLLRGRPLRDLDKVCGCEIGAWRDWLAHDRDDCYWAQIAFNRQMNRISLPVFHISGWYDDVLVGTLINHSKMNNETRSPQKLLIGPWPHRINTTSRYGEIDFGPAGIIDLFDIQREWFDRWLKALPARAGREAPVSYYMMGVNQWKDDQQWPPSSVKLQKFYLNSNGNANTRLGDGKLDTVAPVFDRHDDFDYDPLKPVPFLTQPGWTQLGGPDDYREVESRSDVLVYSTQPLERALVIAGPLIVHLYAASSAKDTDFTARVLDVHPNGYAMRLNDGIVRARFRASYSSPMALIPDQVYGYHIDCWATSHVFEKGHTVRLEISSSAFPRFDPNLNTGLPIGTDVMPVTARQRIHHGSQYPSHIALPVMRSPGEPNFSPKEQQ